MNLRWIAIPLLAAGVAAHAEIVAPLATTQSSVPATPTVERPLEDLVRDLGSSDQSLQDAARSELMLLNFKEIGKLKQTVGGKRLTKSQVAALQEIVTQVFIANEIPKAGPGWGFMGINMPISSDDDERAALPAIIPGRVIGCDAYRVLRDGDTVIGMQGITRKDAEMTVITSYRDLRTFLRSTAAGDWILIRAIRNGEPVEMPLHLGLRNDNVNQQQMMTIYKSLAERFWKEQFAPALEQATETPAS